MTIEGVTTGNINHIYWSKIPGFLKRQVQQVREGGLPVFGHKFFRLLLLLPALPVVLFIRLLCPFVVIRFGELFSERIGHFAGNTELYLCEHDAGINVPHKPFMDIWYHMPCISNLQLKKMWDRILFVWPAILVVPVVRLNRFLPGREAHMIPWPCKHDRDVLNLLERFPPHLTFSSEEEEQGQAGLRELGVPEGMPFVCFHARDSAYLESIYLNFDTRYHDFRDSDINNYAMAAEELTRRGYYVIRMGAVVKVALHVSNSHIINYATNGHRTDFMDIYLGAKCTFFITSGTGIDAVAEIFRRPLMVVNYVPLEYVRSWNTSNLTIFKKYWLPDKSRFMTFREILDSGAGRFLRTQQFEEQGIELVENTPQEITALAIEMDERLKGTWETTKEDEELRGRFWGLFPKSDLHGKMVSHIGTEFLRQHRDWLE